MVKKLKLNFLLQLSVLFAVCIYSNLLPEPFSFSSRFRTLFPLEKINKISGKVISSPVKSLNTGNYTLELECQKVSGAMGWGSSRGNVKLVLPGESVEAYFPGKLYTQAQKSGAVFCDSGVMLAVEGKFINKTNDEINPVFVAKKVSELNQEKTFWNTIARIRRLCRLQFKRLLYSWGPAGALVLALITGMREYCDGEVVEAFRVAGLSHILALSGMHLSLFNGISGIFTKKIFGKRKAGNIFQFIIIILFVFLAGRSPSLFRAFLCSTITMILGFLGIKNYKLINVLALAFLIHSILFPGDMKNFGFILSYGALAGILIFSDCFSKIINYLVPSSLGNSVSASLGAQIITAPVTLYKSGVFSPVGIISTVVVSPMITVFIYSALACIALSLCFPFVSDAAAFLMKILYNVIVFTVCIFAKIKPLKLEN